MKLTSFYEAKSQYTSFEVFHDVDIWDTEGWGSANVKVFYDFEPEDYTDHPYGEGTAREHHPASLDITSVELLTDMEEYDEDGELSGNVLTKGTDLTKHKMWKPEYTTYFEREIGEALDNQEPDEPDHDDRDWDDR